MTVLVGDMGEGTVDAGPVAEPPEGPADDEELIERSDGDIPCEFRSEPDDGAGVGLAD